MPAAAGPHLTDAALLAASSTPPRSTHAARSGAVALPGPAEAFLDVARAQMAGAIRAWRPRARWTRPHLVAFGGAAGGQRAASVAERLGIRTPCWCTPPPPGCAPTARCSPGARRLPCARCGRAVP
ncbi:MAG: hypothetical protein R3F59_20100 [Myxococcota bacterium]